ncbi:MAG: peptidoglycan D,D-transpeptidase FtsI family protein [Lachnospiraceae bacterium]
MKRKKIEKKRKNKEIVLITYSFLLLFLAMIGYLITYVYKNETILINNSYNKRQQILLSQNIRGSIYSSDGEILAQSIIDEEGNERREYPFDNLFSHVVGYSTKGKTGVEDIANYFLINSNVSISEKIANEVQNTKNPGNNVYTTLNSNLQKVASNALGVSKGAIIVTEVKTGKILAMVSKPDFDPNTIVEDWDTYVEDHINGTLLNRTTQGLYPPGSTFKIVTALEYIRENPNTYDSYSYQCNSTFSIGNSRIRCYHGTSHGAVSLMKSFAKSCNTSFANMGVSFNKTAYQATLDSLGFNQALPTKFNYSTSNIVVDEATTEDDLIQLSIGQGNAQITPLLLNMITASIGNGGVAMKPQIIDYVKSATGSSLQTFRAETYKVFMSNSEAEILTSLMESVVENGTGTKLKGLSYSAAGKTGSAEYNNVKEDSHAWFTGFAPVEDPEIAVTIIVEGIGSGGDYAVPIAKRLFDAYFGVSY